jgi:hypothetical protein
MCLQRLRDRLSDASISRRVLAREMPGSGNYCAMGSCFQVGKQLELSYLLGNLAHQDAWHGSCSAQLAPQQER